MEPVLPDDAGDLAELFAPVELDLQPVGFSMSRYLIMVIRHLSILFTFQLLQM